MTRRNVLAILIGLAVGGLYLANGRRELGGGDFIPTHLLTIALIRGDGVVLDRYADTIHELYGAQPYFVTVARGHLVSRYPVAPALLAVPFAIPQVFLLDRLRPGWEGVPGAVASYPSVIGKVCAAAIAALLAAVLWWLLRALDLPPEIAAGVTIIAAAGSSLWTIASQSLWQHGPAALMLTVAIACLVCPPRRVSLIVAGVAVALMVACRSIDVVLTLPIVGWVVIQRRRQASYFIVPALLGAALLLAYNLWYFGAVSGGLAELETMHPGMHAVSETWSPHILAGAAGTLVSPSRGLFVFMPWVVLALAIWPASRSPLRGSVVLPTVAYGLPAYLLVLSAYAVWWAGWSFGPRYWTDAIPLFAIMLGMGLQWAVQHARPLALAILGMSVIAISIQGIGAFCYTDAWNFEPTNVDQHHERLWDWPDSVIIRSARECLTRHVSPK